ncbi:MAG: carotenoid 1,2-hydratase [Rhodoferax sp.]|nr:carotenoid 1,2-hydratase [Rhodoferax sp.]
MQSTAPSTPSPSQTIGRRTLLGAGMGVALAPRVPAAPLPRKALVFPRDAGAHPDYAIEWWYVTGYALDENAKAAFGFQVTFFRSRIPSTQSMQSSLAARQLVFAHAALTDVKGRKLWHDQRMARSSGAEPADNPNDSAWTSTQDTNIQLRDWSLARQGPDLQARITAQDFSIAVTLTASQPVLLQGDRGLSQKGPDSAQTSYYYSLPHLQVRGELVLQGQRYAVGTGSTAWLDHEWSQQVMPPQAVGWDWLGINLLDGSALTAFRLRDRQGNAVWDGGSFRAKDRLFTFQRGEVDFKPLRNWKSPQSQASYPVEWLVRTPADFYTVRALVDNQELDSRTSTGGIYWEGLCEVWDSNQRLVGRGYLEMTGYASPMRL